MFYTLIKQGLVFDQSERVHGPIYNIIKNIVLQGIKTIIIRNRLNALYLKIMK